MWKMLKTGLSGAWALLDLTRRSLANLLLLLLIVFIGLELIYERTPSVPDKSLLVVTLTGSLVEKGSMGSREAALSMAIRGQESETRLRDVLQALNTAANDKSVSGVLMRVEDLEKAGMASLREIGAAMDAVKAEGKRVTVWSSSFTQRQYMIAAHAGEVFLHPMGQVMLTGIGGSRLYWGEALKSAGVTVHVFKAGAYKSFPESYVLGAPSAESLQADRFWMNDAWRQVLDSVQSSRGLMPGSITKLIDTLPEQVRKAEGDMSRVALDNNLIDGVKTYDEVLDILRDRQNGSTASSTPLRRIGYLDYIAAREPRHSGKKSVAVVTLEGEIREGGAEAGRIGSRSTSRILRQVKNDESVSALVVRVDSPGGSAVASETIRREIEQVRKAGKPVVISMGDCAASGGYWLSLAGSRVFADPLTVTGSIGVFGMMPTFEKSLEKFKIGSGGASTTWLTHSQDLTRPMDERYERIMELTVGRTYDDFIRLVSASRKLAPEKVKDLAQGRVYTGAQAMENGLVDELGGIGDAISAARTLAKLGSDSPIIWKEDETSSVREWVQRLLMDARLALGIAMPADALIPGVRITNEIERLSELVKIPGQSMAHCLCEPM